MDEKKKKQPDFKEKREARRIPKEVTVQYRLKDDPARADITHTKNISEKGAFFYAAPYFGTGTILSLCLRLPGYNCCVEVEARVISCAGTSSGTIHPVGVEFINLSESLRGSLKIFIQKFLEATGEKDGKN